MSTLKPRPARKYILVPEFKPLFAMAKCFGPTRGPLEKPTATTIPVIGELLKQSGRDAVSVYEVIRNPDGKTWSIPVQLTPENYNLPYEEIVSGKKNVEEIKHELVNMNEPIAPKKATAPLKPAAPKKNIVHELDDTVRVGGDVEIKTVEPVMIKVPEEVQVNLPVPEEVKEELVREETLVVAEVVQAEPETTEVPVEEAPTEVVDEQPKEDRPLTKAERRALRRAEREQQNQNS